MPVVIGEMTFAIVEMVVVIGEMPVVIGEMPVVIGEMPTAIREMTVVRLEIHVATEVRRRKATALGQLRLRTSAATSAHGDRNSRLTRRGIVPIARGRPSQ